MLSGSAERLEAALSGAPADPRVADDLASARELQDLVSGRRAPLAPDPGFVIALRERLIDEPLPASSVASGARAGVRSGPGSGVSTAARPEGHRPRVLALGGRPGRGLRWATGGALGLLLVGAGVCVAGRSSLPGEPLYAARHVVDRVGVVLGGNEQNRGVRLLDVAERHVDDALLLAARPDRSPPDLRAALADGVVATREGRQTLVSDFAARTDPQSLTDIGAFAGRVLPRTDGLVLAAPGVTDAVTLRAEVLAMRDDALRRLAACTTCGLATDDARRALATLSPTQGPGLPTTPATPVPATTSPRTSTAGGTAPTSVSPTSAGEPGLPGPSGPSPGSTARPTAPEPTTATSTSGATDGSAPANPTSPGEGPTTQPPAPTPLPSLPGSTSTLPTPPPLPTVPTPDLTASITLGG